MYFIGSVKGELPELIKRTTNGTGNQFVFLAMGSFRKTAVLRDLKFNIPLFNLI